MPKIKSSSGGSTFGVGTRLIFSFDGCIALNMLETASKKTSSWTHVEIGEMGHALLEQCNIDSGHRCAIGGERCFDGHGGSTSQKCVHRQMTQRKEVLYRSRFLDKLRRRRGHFAALRSGFRKLVPCGTASRLSSRHRFNKQKQTSLQHYSMSNDGVLAIERRRRHGSES